MGNERQVPLTLDSGPYTMAYTLDRIGADVAAEDVEGVLAECRAAIAQRGRLLTDDEVREIARLVRPAGPLAREPVKQPQRSQPGGRGQAGDVAEPHDRGLRPGAQRGPVRKPSAIRSLAA